MADSCFILPKAFQIVKGQILCLGDFIRLFPLKIEQRLLLFSKIFLSGKSYGFYCHYNGGADIKQQSKKKQK